MKTFIRILYIIPLLTLWACEEKQIVGDSACPNCPVVSKVDPPVAQEGSEVTVTGQRFGSDKSKVTLEIITEPQKTIITSADILSVTDTEIKFKVPAGRQGMGKIVVKVDVGTEILASDDIGITDKPADILFAFSGKGQFTIATLSGQAGDEVIIKGINFGTKKEDIVIKIGTVNIPQENILSVSDTEIKFRIPKGVPAKDNVVVLVSNFAVGGVLEFTYDVPKITTTALKGAKDEKVIIQGTNFTPLKTELKLFIGSVEIAAANIESATDTEIKFKVPRGIGSGKITLKVSDFEAVEKPDFQYLTTYTVGTFSYTTGIAGTDYGSVRDFKIDTASGSDVIYLGYQQLLENTYIIRIENNPGSPAIPVAVPFNLPQLLRTKNAGGQYIFPAFRWLVPLGDKILYHYITSFGSEEYRITEIAKSPSTPSPRFVERSSKNGIDFSNATAANANQLYATGSITSSGPDNGSSIYSLTRSNTAGSRFAYSSIYNSTTYSFDDIEFYNGQLYLCDAKNYKIYIYQQSKGKLWTFSTISGGGTSTADNAPIASAGYRAPTDLAFDMAGDMFICDSENSIIRKISKLSSAQPLVSTIAGDLNMSGKVDGIGKNARFNRPTFLSIGKGGRIYVYDAGNGAIRVITPD
ncbi:MAG: IPT/TIG domain-containing protein [Dyadobacter sp.]|uniref:IPT/TIG domain-containing protein n=1 Tax=Dyadobacter sp. TaxID=1914288 RepID=UPI003262E466